MGEFTQNLLKLTEFPFSYSLIGLLALIFGQGINLEELSCIVFAIRNIFTSLTTFTRVPRPQKIAPEASMAGWNIMMFFRSRRSDFKLRIRTSNLVLGKRYSTFLITIWKYSKFSSRVIIGFVITCINIPLRIPYSQYSIW